MKEKHIILIFDFLRKPCKSLVNLADVNLFIKKFLLYENTFIKKYFRMKYVDYYRDF